MMFISTPCPIRIRSVSISPKPLTAAPRHCSPRLPTAMPTRRPRRARSGSAGPGSASSAGPGSASSARAGYEGSRKVRQRFEYSQASGAGFVELAPEFVVTGEQFFKQLKAVPGIVKASMSARRFESTDAVSRSCRSVVHGVWSICGWAVVDSMVRVRSVVHGVWSIPLARFGLSVLDLMSGCPGQALPARGTPCASESSEGVGACA